MENALFIENEINSIRPAKPTSKALSIVGSSRSNGDRGIDNFYPTPSYLDFSQIRRTFKWERQVNL